MLSLAISAYSLGKSWDANIPERYMTFRGVCIARRVGYKNKSGADFQRISAAFCGAGEGGRTLTLSELVPKTSASAIPPLPHELSFSLSIFLGIVKAAEMPLFKRNPAGQSAALPLFQIRSAHLKDGRLYVQTKHIPPLYGAYYAGQCRDKGWRDHGEKQGRDQQAQMAALGTDGDGVSGSSSAFDSGGTVRCFAGPTIFGARAGAGAAPAQLGVSVGQPRWTSCGQHPGGGQLSDYAGFGRMAADQNRAHSGSTAQPHYGLRDALRGKNVLRRGVGGRLYGYPYQQRCSEPSKNSGPALGGSSHPDGCGCY